KGQKMLNGLDPVLDIILGGWQTSGILTLQSGSPFNVAIAGDIANCGCGNRPDRIGNGNLPRGERTISRWFDISAFTPAPPFVHRTVGQNFLSAPGWQTLDYAFLKIFRTRERSPLHSRGELFNAFNPPTLGSPAASINVPPTAGKIFSAAPGRQMQFGL